MDTSHGGVLTPRIFVLVLEIRCFSAKEKSGYRFNRSLPCLTIDHVIILEPPAPCQYLPSSCPQQDTIREQIVWFLGRKL